MIIAIYSFPWFIRCRSVGDRAFSSAGTTCFASNTFLPERPDFPPFYWRQSTALCLTVTSNGKEAWRHPWTSSSRRTPTHYITVLVDSPLPLGLSSQEKAELNSDGRRFPARQPERQKLLEAMSPPSAPGGSPLLAQTSALGVHGGRSTWHAATLLGHPWGQATAQLRTGGQVTAHNSFYSSRQSESSNGSR